MPYSYTKKFTLTDSVNGHRITPLCFGHGECNDKKFYIYYMKIVNGNNRKIDIKFSIDDDWMIVTLPSEFNNILTHDFWIRENTENEVTVMVTIKGSI